MNGILLLVGLGGLVLLAVVGLIIFFVDLFNGGGFGVGIVGILMTIIFYAAAVVVYQVWVNPILNPDSWGKILDILNMVFLKDVDLVVQLVEKVKALLGK